MNVEPAVIRLSAANVTFSVTRRAYPEPPERFVATPDVETLWHRYEG